MKILVVEDDRELAQIVRRALEERVHNVELAFDGENARHLALHYGFALILLDVMLPKLDGIAVCRSLREAGVRTPVIMLTARDSVDDRILGLDAGADDYLVKPFSMKELFARIRAVWRRSEPRLCSVLKVGDLSLDPSANYVDYRDRRVPLTAKEFTLLHLFMQHPDKVLTRTEILEHVWDSNYEGLGNVVDVYVNYLRNKLAPELIQTVRGRGYLLRSDSNAR